MMKIYKNIKMPSKMNKAKVDKNRKPCFMQDLSFIVFFFEGSRCLKTSSQHKRKPSHHNNIP